MCAMRWVFICLCVGMAAGDVLRCDNRECDDTNNFYTSGRRDYTVEGHDIEFFYKNISNQTSGELYVDCKGWQVLDSPAMPRFDVAIRVSSVDLRNCPPPAHNVSIAAALAALNITLQPVDDHIYLELPEFPAELLTPYHFVGLEQLTYLKIYSKYGVDPHQRPTPVAGFLAGLRKLRTLHLVGLRLPAGELYRLPKSLNRLWLCGESLNSLPGTLPEITSETVRALPTLRYLMIDQWEYSAPEFPYNKTSVVQNHLNTTYALESIYLSSWKERRPTPLESCDALRSLEFRSPKVEQLPERWVAACPLLEELTMEFADQLTSVPAKLLDGATALKRLTIRGTKIRSLPEGFLRGAPNLLELDLSINRLRETLPSGAFLGPSLQSLSLSGNKLRSASLAALAPLTSLTKLDYSENMNTNRYCQENGYSPFVNLTHLKQLSLRENPVTHICRDWRENLTLLETLDLLGTNIDVLKFTDFLFTREASVKDAEVTLSPSIYTTNFTKENYEAALAAPGPGVTFKFQPNWRYKQYTVSCDCRTYWLRRAVDAARVVRVEGLLCANNKDFKRMPLEEMCPGEARTTQ